MSEGLERLRNIGAQKIHEETHVSLEYIQAILHESFEGLSKVQFLGFVSILQREYRVDLSELRASGLKYFEHEVAKKEQSVFVAPKKKMNLTPLYILIALSIFALSAYLSLNESSTLQEENVTLIDNRLIEDVQKKIVSEEINETIDETLDESEVDETNLTQEAPALELSSEEEEAPLESVAPLEPSETPATLSISTEKKVWLGYINLKSNKHYVKTFSGSFDFDTSKDWLIVLGHGYVDMIVDGEREKFKSAQNLRFIYQNRELKKLTQKEFRGFNRGRLW